MKVDDYNKALLDSVKARLPANVNPVWFLMNTLSIGKEAAYRRLRGEVPLILQEAVLLSKALGVSLNEFVDTAGNKVQYYSIFLVDFETPDESDYKILQAYLDSVNQSRDDPSSYLGVTTSMFPLQLSLSYEPLVKYSLFKWLYLTGRRQAKAYHAIKIADRMHQFLIDLQKAYSRFSTTCYIFDSQLGHSLVNDMRYFISVGLLSSEEAKSICDEAHKMLDSMEQIAITGRYENGNAAYMYVSDIHFNKSYHIIKAAKFYAGIIEICVLNGLVSTGEHCYRKMNEWFNSRRRLSTLITQSSEPHRIAFFKEQRRQLDEL